MTENEAIQQLEFDRAMALFDPATGEVIKPEILKALNKENYLTYMADEVAIKALKEIQQYRAIGTVEECREAKRFKEYFDEFYGIGLEVANWHQNGNTEPFDNFYDAAIDWSEQNE